ncbi:hypothetical protein E5222_12900 [Alteraurantiacibacter aquimixticola]|uniref:Fibronectin type III domain-containing protein n=1 Tax=Alteraurantiacibacter aquimixticola TaxID=2489173 RepID=A0A4T3F0Z5_9SPHN|nr:hypothetical protein E5222_12900 [Alteraurantiacibacter aquimixticola]
MLLPAAPAAASAPEWADGGALASDTGHVLLEWQASEPVTLSIAREANFSDARELYEGTASSYFLSGLSDGEYHLRLQAAGGKLSEPAVLTVAHQSLAQALWLTLIGLIITAGIIATIWRGARND